MALRTYFLLLICSTFFHSHLRAENSPSVDRFLRVTSSTIFLQYASKDKSSVKMEIERILSLACKKNKLPLYKVVYLDNLQPEKIFLPAYYFTGITADGLLSFYREALGKNVGYKYSKNTITFRKIKPGELGYAKIGRNMLSYGKWGPNRGGDQPTVYRKIDGIPLKIFTFKHQTPAQLISDIYTASRNNDPEPDSNRKGLSIAYYPLLGSSSNFLKSIPKREFKDTSPLEVLRYLCDNSDKRLKLYVTEWCVILAECDPKERNLRSYNFTPFHDKEYTYHIEMTHDERHLYGTIRKWKQGEQGTAKELSTRFEAFTKDGITGMMITTDPFFISLPKKFLHSYNTRLGKTTSNHFPFSVKTKNGITTLEIPWLDSKGQKKQISTQ